MLHSFTPRSFQRRNALAAKTPMAIDPAIQRHEGRCLETGRVASGNTVGTAETICG